MKIKKMSSLIMIIFAMMFLLVGLTYAQEDDGITDSTVGINQENDSVDANMLIEDDNNITILANVNIWDAKISNQDGNNLTIDFDINNGIGKVQPNIKYAVQLFNKNDKSRRLILEKVFSDVVNVPENTTIHKTISYVAPDYLKGNFDVDIVSKSSGSLPLGGTNAGNITLNGSGEYINIQNENCSLIFKDGSDKDNHTLQEGIIVKKDDKKTFISCDIENNFGKIEKVIPYITVYNGSNFGKKVKEEKRDIIALTSGEEKTVKLELPKMDKPQLYSMTLFFKKDIDSLSTSDSTLDNTISNEVSFIYIVSGESASIQNIRLSKDYYKKGEDAVVILNWLGDVSKLSDSKSEAIDDNHPIIANVEIKSANGQKCAESVNKELDKASQMKNVSIVIPIINNCLNPSGVIKLVAENGTVFDQQDFKVKSDSALQSKNNSEKNSNKKITSKKIMAISIIVLGIIIIIGLVIIVFKKNRKIGGSMSILLFLLTASFVFSTENVEAATFSASGVPVTLQMNKSVYRLGENATLTMNVNTTVAATMLFVKHAQYKFSAGFNGHTLSSSGSVSGRVQNRAGRYNANIRAYEQIYTVGGIFNLTTWGPWQSVLNKNISYTVRAPSPPPPPPKTNPRAIIDAPANNSTFQQGQQITFVGHGILGSGGGSINGYAWADVRPGTPSYNGTRCACADGFGGRCLTTSGSTGTYRTTGLSVGSHRICFNVRQRYNDGTTRWAGSNVQRRNITITAPSPVNGACGNKPAQRNGNYTVSETNYPTGSQWCQSGNRANPNPGWVYPNPGQTVTWNCVGSNGGTTANCLAKRNVGAPTPDLKINSSDGPITNVPVGGNLNLTWPAVANATSCSANGAGWGGNKSPAGGNNTVAASTTSTYTLSCTGPGGTGIDSVQVNICTPNYSYTCVQTNNEATYCANHCGEPFVQTNNCLVADTNSCSGPNPITGFKNASVCATNGITCQASESAVSCPACPNESNWIEVLP